MPSYSGLMKIDYLSKRCSFYSKYLLVPKIYNRLKVFTKKRQFICAVFKKAVIVFSKNKNSHFYKIIISLSIFSLAIIIACTFTGKQPK